MSTSGILNTARNAVYAHQRAVQVASHNIGNVETEGYSKQRVRLSAGTPQLTPLGPIGTGVVVDDVERVRDRLADEGVRRESGKAAGYNVRKDVLGQVETIFGEPSDTGIAASLDAFWNAWSDLANQPSSSSARTLVRQRGEQVAQSLGYASERLGELEAGLRANVSATVDRINEVSKQIADLNVEIVRSEAGGHTASDLRDTRDRLLDTLATLGSTRVVERIGGSVTVVMDGTTLVEGSTARQLGVRSDGVWTVTVGSDTVTFPAEGSRLGEMMNLLNRELPAVRTGLDQLARGVVAAVNEIHRSGWSPDPAPDGTTGIDFFDQSGGLDAVNAGNLSLSAAVRADPRVIAASTSDPARRGSTNNEVAMAMAALRDSATRMPPPPEPGTSSFAASYRELVTGVALKVNSAENSATVYEALARNAENRRSSISGVSTDEELIGLIRHQQAYTAATRLVKAVDEMMDAILHMV